MRYCIIVKWPDSALARNWLEIGVYWTRNWCGKGRLTMHSKWIIIGSGLQCSTGYREGEGIHECTNKMTDFLNIFFSSVYISKVVNFIKIFNVFLSSSFFSFSSVVILIIFGSKNACIGWLQVDER